MAAKRVPAPENLREATLSRRCRRFARGVPGGFTGVDIFFVISGFLITSLIVRSKDKGDFSFADFYARRIKRIFPALIVVLLAGLAIGWIVMFPGEYRDLGKHNAAGAGFVANFSFLQEAGYFDVTADHKPLLHLWSLGIALALRPAAGGRADLPRFVPLEHRTDADQPVAGVLPAIHTFLGADGRLPPGIGDDAAAVRRAVAAPPRRAPRAAQHDHP